MPHGPYTVLSDIRSPGKLITINVRDIVVAHARVHFIKEDKGLSAYVTGVFVDENQRRKGYASSLYETIAILAKKKRCYKIVATSRKKNTHVHEMMKKLGYKQRGYEFRLEI